MTEMTTKQSPLISLNDLNKHKSKSDCWIAVHSKVWDITNFVDEHPGGPSGKPPRHLQRPPMFNAKSL